MKCLGYSFGKLFLGADGPFSPVLKWALLAGVSVHLVGFVAFRVISNPLPEQDNKRPFVAFLPERMFDEDQVLMEQAALFDTAPLFIPTKWSGYTLESPITVTQPRSLFELYEPEIELAENLRGASLEPSEGYDVQLANDLDLIPRDEEFSSFGIGALHQTPAQETWKPLVRLTAFADDRKRIESSVPLELPLEGFTLVQQRDCAIRLGLKSASNGILLMPPFVIESSGDAAFDRALSEWLSSPVTVAKLPRGYIEIEIFL